jgi:tripartite-type tricarboxylate transporter receptor subunit TctC
VPELPDVPTMAKAGVPDMNIVLLTEIFVRTGISPVIAAKLEHQSKKIMLEADKPRSRTLVTDSVGRVGGEFKETIESELRVTKKSNIEIK